MRLVLTTVVFLTSWNCASTEAVDRPEPAKDSLQQFIAKYEKSFRPSAYDVDPNVVKTEEEKQFDARHISTVYTAAAPETIPGFRIQVLLTQEIDEADSALTNLEQQVPQEYAYKAYDAPYYKVRVGNFQERGAASLLRKKLIELGYKDSWIVPDNILKNPPPKLPNIDIEPKRFIDQNR